MILETFFTSASVVPFDTIWKMNVKVQCLHLMALFKMSSCTSELMSIGRATKTNYSMFGYCKLVTCYPIRLHLFWPWDRTSIPYLCPECNRCTRQHKENQMDGHCRVISTIVPLEQHPTTRARISQRLFWTISTVDHIIWNYQTDRLLATRRMPNKVHSLHLPHPNKLIPDKSSI